MNEWARESVTTRIKIAILKLYVRYKNSWSQVDTNNYIHSLPYGWGSGTHPQPWTDLPGSSLFLWGWPPFASRKRVLNWYMYMYVLCNYILCTVQLVWLFVCLYVGSCLFILHYSTLIYGNVFTVQLGLYVCLYVSKEAWKLT